MHRSRSSRRRHHRRVVRSSMVPHRSRGHVAETPPLMKVIPQRDGKFLLEPLTPKKTITTPYSRPLRNSGDDDRISSEIRKYNTFEPWDFSDLVLSMAKAYKHAPYARGCSLETSSATDCSGFVQFIYHGFKINLPRSSAEQAQVGKTVTRRMDFSKLLPGDLLFFRRGGHVGHAGIYLGEGKMIHASNHRTGVTVTDLREPYYERTFVVAKRVFVVKYP
ncbi:MAG: C40 family peptidase [Deltaproteobacteria bacterium]